MLLLLITRLFFGESFLVEQPVPEIPARQIIHHQVQLLLILERALHIDNKRVVERQQDLLFVQNGRDTLFDYDFDFGYLFQRVESFVFVEFYFPDLAEAS